MHENFDPIKMENFVFSLKEDSNPTPNFLSPALSLTLFFLQNWNFKTKGTFGSCKNSGTIEKLGLVDENSDFHISVKIVLFGLVKMLFGLYIWNSR